MSELDIQQTETESGGRYFVTVSGHEAEMTYSRAGEKIIIIDHTGVPSELGGQGVGTELVLKAVEDARRHGRKIVPLCPFAKAQFEKHAEWKDVLR
jgi:predicted GNAT family acetyltransferase